MSRRLSPSCAGRLGALALAFHALTFAAAPPQRVLLLNSYHPGYEWSDEETRGIREVLVRARPDLEIDIEYLDHRRRPGNAYESRFSAFLSQKYANWKPDLVITVDDFATEFFLVYGPAIAPGTPIVFCGVNYRNDYSRSVQRARERGSPVTGVLERVELVETARVALGLHPGTKQIVTVGEDVEDRYDLDLMRALPGIEARPLSPYQMPLERLGRALESLPSGSMVLLSAFSRDGLQRQLTITQSARFVAAHCRVPIYGLSKDALGYGIVGGKLNDGYYQGRAAGEMAVAVLNGAAANQIPVRNRIAQPFQFDNAELERWKIRNAELPAGSIIVGRRPSFYEQYRTAIIAGAVFVVAQSVVIVLLLFQRARRKRAELALQASGEHLRGVLNALFAFVGVITTDGILIESNTAPLEAAGIQAADVLGKPFWECYWWSHSAEEQERLRAAILKARAGESTRYDVEIRVKNGVLPVDFMLTPMRSAYGPVSYLIASAVPIAQRKRAEETLRKSEEQFRMVAEALPGMLSIADPAGRLLYVNQYHQQYTGLGGDASVGELGLRLVHPDDIERTQAACERCMRDGRVFEIEHRVRRHDGSWRWHLTRSIPLRSKSGEIERWLGISIDIEAQKQAEATLRRGNDDLRQLIWAASHDLHEPARIALTFTQLLAERCGRWLDGQGKQFLRHATDGARRLCDHLGALRAYWEVSAENAAAPERIDMNALLADVLQSLETAIGEAGAMVTSTEMPALIVERTSAVQVLYHMLRNAIQYRHRDRPLRIDISAVRNEPGWMFHIQDNGVGIAPEHRRHVFDLFKRLHSHRDVAGSGMGLALCRRIIERAGGQIGVDSEFGQGSCFWFTLPQTVVEENSPASYANSAY